MIFFLGFIMYKTCVFHFKKRKDLLSEKLKISSDLTIFLLTLHKNNIHLSTGRQTLNFKMVSNVNSSNRLHSK